MKNIVGETEQWYRKRDEQQVHIENNAWRYIPSQKFAPLLTVTNRIMSSSPPEDIQDHENITKDDPKRPHLTTQITLEDQRRDHKFIISSQQRLQLLPDNSSCSGNCVYFLNTKLHQVETDIARLDEKLKQVSLGIAQELTICTTSANEIEQQRTVATHLQIEAEVLLSDIASTSNVAMVIEKCRTLDEDAQRIGKQVSEVRLLAVEEENQHHTLQKYLTENSTISLLYFSPSTKQQQDEEDSMFDAPPSNNRRSCSSKMSPSLRPSSMPRNYKSSTQTTNTPADGNNNTPNNPRRIGKQPIISIQISPNTTRMRNHNHEVSAVPCTVNSAENRSLDGCGPRQESSPEPSSLLRNFAPLLSQRLSSRSYEQWTPNRSRMAMETQKMRAESPLLRRLL